MHRNRARALTILCRPHTMTHERTHVDKEDWTFIFCVRSNSTFLRYPSLVLFGFFFKFTARLIPPKLRLTVRHRCNVVKFIDSGFKVEKKKFKRILMSPNNFKRSINHYVFTKNCFLCLLVPLSNIKHRWRFNTYLGEKASIF